ncbi:hypothetical protein L1887_28186 [Cichorium endivia]|nr:hypothetical protein L1887_28186 [Cichorium endivia]
MLLNRDRRSELTYKPLGCPPDKLKEQLFRISETRRPSFPRGKSSGSSSRKSPCCTRSTGPSISNQYFKKYKIHKSLKDESYAIMLTSDGKLAWEDIDKFSSSPPDSFPVEEGPVEEEPFPPEEGPGEEELDQLAPAVEEEPFPPEEAPAITSCSHRKKPHP